MLRDDRGKTYGHRDVDIELTTEDGRLVVLRERVTFSDMVTQPILSFGRLLKSGWAIRVGAHVKAPTRVRRVGPSDNC